MHQDAIAIDPARLRVGTLIRDIYKVPATAGRRSRLAREWRERHAALAADRRYICRGAPAAR